MTVLKKNNVQHLENDSFDQSDFTFQQRALKKKKQSISNMPLKDLSFWNDEQDDDDNHKSSTQSMPARMTQGKKESKKVIYLSIGVIVVSSIWLAYRFFASSSQNIGPILIQAPQGPYKVIPEERGGMYIPDQDKLVYNRLKEETSEAFHLKKVLPPSETPLDLNPTIDESQEGENNSIKETQNDESLPTIITFSESKPEDQVVNSDDDKQSQSDVVQNNSSQLDENNNQEKDDAFVITPENVEEYIYPEEFSKNNNGARTSRKKNKDVPETVNLDDVLSSDKNEQDDSSSNTITLDEKDLINLS